MKQTEYIASLLEKFLEGQSTEAEEQVLSDFFNSTENVPAEWVAYRELFRSFKTDAYDFSDEEIDAMLAPTPSKKGIVVNFLRWSAVACATIAYWQVHGFIIRTSHHLPQYHKSPSLPKMR